MRSCAFAGWDVVLETTSTLRLPADKLADLFEQVPSARVLCSGLRDLAPTMLYGSLQVILELAEMNERDSARAILRQTPVLRADR